MSIRLQDLQTELALETQALEQFLRTAGVTVPEGVKRMSDKDASRIRSIVRETRRREAKKRETVKLPSIINVRTLAEKLELPAGEVIKNLMKNGVMATLNEDMDYETAAIVASDLGYATEEDVAQLEEDILTPEKLEEILTKETPEKQVARPPVVTIMGHVDHGKTTLLDTIRSATVAQGEAGGITQRISSYQAKKKGKMITFIDTPGHEAFEFMRKRGASLADIGILVVAGNDGVQEQTREAVKHAKDAGLPIIVAVTKMDTPDANVDRVKRQVADIGLVPEDYGGDTPVVALSAVTGQGIDTLLDTILLVADVLGPCAVPDRPALATVVESRREASMGAVVAVLIHAGTLRVGNYVVVGQTAGVVRQLLDYNGRPIKEAKPSTPVTIIGLEDVPEAGNILQAVSERTTARTKAKRVGLAKRLPQASPTPTQPKSERAEAEPSETPSTLRLLPLVLKADSRGSLEAIRQTIEAMGTSDVAVRMLRADVGAISETDVQTAAAAQGVILGFSVNTFPMAARIAEKNTVPIQNFHIIYELADAVRQRLEDLLPPEVLREDLGKLNILKVFFSIRGRQIVGGRVTTGVVKKGEKADVVRGTAVVATGTLSQVQQNRTDTDSVKAGQECGVTFEGNGKMKEGDTLVVYHEEVRRRRLGPARAA